MSDERKPYFQRESTANTLLDSFFGKTNEREITNDYIFQVMGRDLRKEKQNKAWLSNCIYVLNMYGLAERIMAKTGGRKGIGVRITEKGLKALGRSTADTSSDSDSIIGSMTVNEAIDDVRRRAEILQNMLPALDVKFDVTLKKEVQPTK